MTPIHNGRPELDYFLAIAQTQRAEAMARTGYILVDGIGRGVRVALGAAAAAVRVLTGAVAAWRRRGAVLRALQGLDDRLLLDIGLTRADLWAVAHGGQLLATDEQQEPLPTDVALSDAAIRGCNDNGTRWRAA